jgi:hypothetical protein
MKTNRILFALFAVCFVFAGSALAGDPTGNWKWSLTTPNGDQIDLSCTFELKDGRLTGKYHSPFGEAEISKASFEDDKITFEVEREFDGNEFVVTYAGALDGDTIMGTITLPSWDGGSPQKSVWKATRSGG